MDIEYCKNEDGREVFSFDGKPLVEFFPPEFTQKYRLLTANAK